MIHSFADQRSGNATVTDEALADRSVFDGFTLGQWYSVVSPAERTIGNPSTLAIGWGYPYLDAGIAVIDLQNPFGFEFSDVAVVNRGFFEGVNYDQVIFAKNQFWLHPEQVSGGSHKNRNRKVKHEATGVRWVENRLSQEDDIQHKSQTSPNQVALRAKNFNHAPIIAGVTALGKGK